MIARAALGLCVQGLLSAQQAERPFHFAHDVAPWLVRHGCAAADCHGGATGRGGLKLSLFGADPTADHTALAVERGGRRIDLDEPDRSLLLRKPTRDLAHGGGLRLPRGGAGHAALRAWIADGAPFAGAPAAPAPQVADLRLELEAGGRLRSVARFTWTEPGSGERRERDEDVSARTLFSTSAPDVVEVSRQGETLRHGPGEAWLFARFAGRDARLRSVEPFGRPEPVVEPDASSVDRAFARGLAELGLAAVGPAPAETLLRRLFLDLAGRLPSPAERSAFLGADPRTRVARTTATLLASPAFAEVATGWLAAWFEVPEPGGLEDARQRPAAAALRADLGRIAADPDASLLDALLGRLERPLFRRLPDPRDRAELFGRAVLGVRLGCARCHDHPLDRWRRDEHLAFAALFVDPRPGPEGGMVAGQLFDEATGDPAEARPLALLGADRPGAPPAVRLAAALRDRPDAFARNLANRSFAALLGRGLCEPVDDHRPTNPVLHAELLATLTRTFVDGGYRLRPLVLAIVTSRVYALDSRPVAGGVRADEIAARHLARRSARPLPEALLHRVSAAALGVAPEAAAAAPSASPLAAWLALWNGPAVRRLLEAEGNTLDLLAGLVEDPDERVDTLFTLLLTRAPTAAEREGLAPLLAEAADPRRALAELAHAIVLSREFTSIR